MLENVCIPINLDAFILNRPTCDTDGPKVLIAPITQPDYVGLRLDNAVIQHDILPPIDLHSSRPAILNPRISKAYSNPLKPVIIQDPEPEFDSNSDGAIVESRLGVYLHWALPRGYRTGSSSAEGTERKDPENASANPTFRLTPNRWLVVRSLKEKAPQEANIPAVDAWIIESDRLSTIEELPGELDIETEVTPFLMYDPNAPTGGVLHSQAEKYIGFKSKSLFTDKYVDVNAPHVPLTIMDSSNPVFADYTLHNPNVFSMKDNFEYDGAKHLQQAKCDYIVIGWHSSIGDGPFGSSGLKGAFGNRIEEFFCSLTNDVSEELQNSMEKTGVITYGVIYDVVYDAKKRPDTIADQYAENFNKGVAMEPIAIGVTPLDAMLTFLHAHQSDDATEERILGPEIGGTVDTILSMTELLYAAGDDYDSRIKAADLISGQSFQSSLGGFTWHYDKKKAKDGPPQSPSTKEDNTGMSEIDYLNELNELQQQLDVTERFLTMARWGLFAEFFKYCSDVNNQVESRRLQYYNKMLDLYGRETTGSTNQPAPKSVVRKLLDTKKTLEDGVGAKSAILDPETSKPLYKKVASDGFKQRTDPTLLIAGIKSGWPSEFLDEVRIRFESQISTQVAPPLEPKISQSVQTILSNLELPGITGNIKTAVSKLLNEATDSVKKSQIGYKKWLGQPFCPIFVEWEAMFYNIDASQWSISLGSSPMSNNNQKQVRYINPNLLHEPSNPADQDTRAVSGRILVMPQPSFALAAVVRQVLDVAGINVPGALQGEQKDKEGNVLKDDKGKVLLTGRIDEKKLQAFVARINDMSFISGDLMGFTDSLLTLGTGSHVKPNVRTQGNDVRPLAEAVDIGPRIGLSATPLSSGKTLMEEIITIMGGDSATAKTPFGTLIDFEGNKFQPFKGVQHGQLALTKLTIVDKFGQAIACPLPKKKTVIPPQSPEFPVHPCIADQLCPTLLPDGTLNTVFPTTDSPTTPKKVTSPFIQITPAINQNARINGNFLQKDFVADGKLASPPWRNCDDWDNPIFGWIVVNYPDSSLQFFTGEGIFFTSLRFSGPSGTITGPQWAPFSSPPPDKAGKLVSQQLVDLIDCMKGNSTDIEAIKKAQEYFRALWGMINGAITNMPFPPSQYSAYANAIVGKPLALVNVGWSLELAEPPKKAQHTLGQQPPPGYEEDMMYSYKFPVKIGDYERPFDGVVAYWDTDNNTPTSTATTNFKAIYTYPYPTSFSSLPEQAKYDPRTLIEPTTFPTLTPYFIDPTTLPSSPHAFTKEKAKKLLVKTLLIDPYTPLHLYSAILPIKSLKLPAWSLEAAMRNMTAFFTLGPVLVTKDVPKGYDVNAPLHADSWLTKQATNDPTKQEDEFPVRLPIAGGKGMWNWLQPYPDYTPPPDGTPIRPLYNALEVGQESGAFRDDPAPYTFLEGFLQLARPLVDKGSLGMR